ncbi:hypothetical protein FRC07_005130 [Ceratobasidium sp. 392]|nr:hypothetical protein FRC07_005130 [Ceratobasidium sp. 392]
MLLTPILELHEDESIMKAGTGLFLSVTLPPFGPDTFRRFTIYGSFVKELVILGSWYFSQRKPIPFQLLSWSTLSLQIQHAPLLPALRTLTMFPRDIPDGDQIVLWLSTFLSPSVETLSLRLFSFTRPVLTHHSTAAILGLLTQKAPRLQKLVHGFSIVSNEYNHVFIEPSTASQLVLSPLACGHLQNSQHLAHLEIGGQFIDSATLAALSRLPKLQQLTISQFMGHNTNLSGAFKDARISVDSFPTLRDFTLYSTTLDDFLAAWNVSSLVSDLKTISLKCFPTGPRRIKEIYEEDVLSSLMFSVSASSPRTQKLILDSIGGADDVPIPIGPEVSSWAHMARLPLSHLTLCHFSVDSASLKNVHYVWSHLIVLELPDQLVTLQHLAYLSQLPELKTLLAAGFKDPVEEIAETQAHGSAPLHSIEFKKRLEDRVKVKSVESVARLWPDLQRIVYTNKSEETLQPDLKLLNVLIRMSQGVAETKKNILTRYGSGALQLFDERLAVF